jgi:hypothetical protein
MDSSDNENYITDMKGMDVEALESSGEADGGGDEERRSVINWVP